MHTIVYSPNVATRPAISRYSIRVAHLALWHMELGLVGSDRPDLLAQVRVARQELAEAVTERR